jgi:DNA-binding CsgD family transcriptional regulator
MLDLLPPSRIASRLVRGATPDPALPMCPVHRDSRVRRYRAQGPKGPGLYPQCVPADGDNPHLLAWPSEPVAAAMPRADVRTLSQSENDVLDDAAEGFTVLESARARFKGTETVKTQRRSILLKLGARNMTHAVAMVNAFCDPAGCTSPVLRDAMNDEASCDPVRGVMD